MLPALANTLLASAGCWIRETVLPMQASACGYQSKTQKRMASYHVSNRMKKMRIKLDTWRTIGFGFPEWREVIQGRSQFAAGSALRTVAAGGWPTKQWQSHGVPAGARQGWRRFDCPKQFRQ
ncbi:MAG: hypothetical protein ACRYF5_19670 [Janthinobacterium lividum]